MPLPPPQLSAFDPEVSAEGSVDPFSFAATSERLAERIFPFITVRMSRPRFLTAMTVGAFLCDDFRDEIAADGKTPPWLVFEWHVIEALFRASGGRATDELWGTRVPGIGMVRAALQAGRSVGADTYLKAPKTFGFHGIYRRLSIGLDILDDEGQPSEGAHQLVATWEADRRLHGFRTGTGAGAAMVSGANGSEVRVNERQKDDIAQRVLLPERAARELAFKLDVD